jgi:hypothetical protein
MVQMVSQGYRIRISKRANSAFQWKLVEWNGDAKEYNRPRPSFDMYFGKQLGPIWKVLNIRLSRIP